MMGCLSMENIFVEFLQTGGLYDKISITEKNVDDLYDLIDGKVKISVFCNECGEKRVFSMAPITICEEKSGYMVNLGDRVRGAQTAIKLRETPRPGQVQTEKDWSWCAWCENETRIMTFSFNCAMDEDHKVDYVVRAEGNTLWKIGQYPSVADLTFPELAEYKKVVSKDDLKELRRAVGLYASGIGIGSYVYLRRVFERIIDEAKDKALVDQKLDQDTYEKSRMTEKIKLLRDYLPLALVDSPSFYGIVSKGIHELSEEDCISYFPVMKEFIFMILRQWEQKRRDAEAEKLIKASISKIASNL